MNISIPTDFLERILKFNEWATTTEYDKYLNYWPILLIGIVLSLLITPIAGYIAKKFNITYLPGEGKNKKEFDNPEKAVHTVETPSLGGLSVTIPLFLAIIVFFRLDPTIIPLFLALTVLIVGSIFDDIFTLSSKAQLGYQITAAILVAISVIDLTNISFFANDFFNLSVYTWSFNILTIPFSFVFPGDLILIIWILLCINSVKWVGGSPGLIESYSLVIFLLLFIISVRTFSLFSSTMSILIVGTLIPLLYFAYPTPKIMSGSSGKTVYGFLISILALIAGLKFSVTLMLLAIPIIDAIYVIIHRAITYKPKNFIDLMKINDTSHLHHKLLKLDLSDKQILLLETSLSLVIGSFAILTTGAIKYFVVIFGIAFVLAFIVFINYRANKKIEPKKESPESKYSY